ncbi:NRP2 [Branchiostoma lanceolatum]|uniref:NRP2 protein n=1 Tax=Branchiostoma lanceolatum TaxID=7740 RepID=A0A8S4MN72_BRALA|nr:NRP2 [Branchiostoma lanceolatum]
MESGAIPNSHITASTEDPGYKAWRGRLNNGKAWQTNTADTDQWLQIDLGSHKVITGIQTQGLWGYHTKTYKLMYSDDASTWVIYGHGQFDRIFDGNSDGTTMVEQTLPTPVTTRYVRINPQIITGRLIRMRVELLGCNEINAALNRPANQSSTASGGVPSRAVDGDDNPMWSEGSCTATAEERDPWWRVDLGTSWSVARVVVTNRKDCCPEQLEGFTVYVGDNSNVTTNPTCGGPQSVGGKGVITVNCGGLTGRYVGIALSGAGRTLTLCEVQVFGGTSLGRIVGPL